MANTVDEWPENDQPPAILQEPRHELATQEASNSVDNRNYQQTLLMVKRQAGIQEKPLTTVIILFRSFSLYVSYLWWTLEIIS